MGDLGTGRSVKRWRNEAGLVRVPVLVCTDSGIFLGNTYRIEDQRLLDALNGGFVARALRMAKDFLPLTEAEVLLPNGERTTLPSVYIRKSGIFFVGEGGIEKADSRTAVEGRRRAHLRRNKTLTETEVHIPPYLLRGNVHVDIWEELLETIDRDQRFMPMTDVKVEPSLTGGASSFDFVAVNKDQVAYLSESPT